MTADRPATLPGPSPEGRRLLLLGLFFVAFGTACRLVRFGLHFPIWGDEASLAFNFIERDYLGLLRQLNHYQVAPILFLWVEKSVFLLTGPSDLGLRVFPLVAGVAGLVLFWRLVRETLPPPAAVLAVGILAVAQWPIEMASSVKPYALDLLAAVWLLWLATGYLRRPERNRFLAALALSAPVVVGLSYPSVFVAGAVSLVLLPAVYRDKAVGTRLWFVAYNGLLVGCFLAQIAFVGREPVAGNPPDLDAYMKLFWNNGFPSGAVGESLSWCVRVHVGKMFSHPLAFNGGGLVGLALVCLGGRWLVHRGRGRLVALCVLPYALHLTAAILHRYPYGMNPRLEQHLLPGFCVLAGSGLVYLLERVTRAEALRRRGLAAATVCLVLVGLGGMAADWRRPHHDDNARWAREISLHLRREVSPGDRIAVRPALEAMSPSLRWQLLPFARQMRSEESPGGTEFPSRLWVLDENSGYAAPTAPEPTARISVAEFSEAATWEIADRRRFAASIRDNPSNIFRFFCDVSRCEPAARESGRQSRASRP